MEMQELLILLIIILVLFGGRRLPSLALGLQESMKEFKQQDAVPDGFWRSSIAFLIAGVGVTVIIVLKAMEAVTQTQALVSIAVLLVWVLTGWLCFGGNKK
jgi:TatA/E family protein of Tat protein translocase